MGMNELSIKGVKIQTQISGCIRSLSSIERQLQKLDEMKESLFQSQKIHQDKVDTLELEYSEWRIQAKSTYHREKWGEDWSLAQIEKNFIKDVESMVNPRLNLEG